MGLEKYEGRIMIHVPSKSFAEELVIAFRPIYPVKLTIGRIPFLSGNDFPKEDVASLLRPIRVFAEHVEAFKKRHEDSLPHDAYTLRLEIWEKEPKDAEDRRHVRIEGYKHLKPTSIEIVDVGHAYRTIRDGDSSGRGYTPHRAIELRLTSQLHFRLMKSAEALLSYSERLDEVFAYFKNYYG